MLTAGKSVSAAHVAFMADVTDTDINRLVDTDVLPRALFLRDHGRRFAPLTAAFASFYFQTQDELTRSARRQVIWDLTARLERRPDFDAFLALNTTVLHADFDWSIHHDFLTVTLDRCVETALNRASRVQEAERSIVEDPEILSGTPCFAGTRLPVAHVVAAIEAGATIAELQEAYPFLNERLIDDARVYVQAHPRPGRPRRIADIDAGAALVSHKVVRRGQNRRDL